MKNAKYIFVTAKRSEKNSNWEGAYRVPAIVRWPGKIPAGVVSNEIMSHLDWMITKSPQVYLGLAQTTQFLQTFAEYPPSQVPDSWSVDKLTEQFLQQTEKGR